jgi:hypothetical protein
MEKEETVPKRDRQQAADIAHDSLIGGRTALSPTPESSVPERSDNGESIIMAKTIS